MVKKVETYTQCTLTKTFDNGDESRHTAWIPNEFAEVGRIVKFERLPGVWEDGYTVSQIFGVRTAEQVEPHERDYLLFSHEGNLK